MDWENSVASPSLSPGRATPVDHLQQTPESSSSCQSPSSLVRMPYHSAKMPSPSARVASPSASRVASPSARMPSQSLVKSSIPSTMNVSTEATSPNKGTKDMPPSSLSQNASLNITTKHVVKPRSECRGGSDQLKLGYKTKTPLTEEQRKARAIERVKAKVGEEVAEGLMKKWKEIQLVKERKKRLLEGDGVIKTLSAIGFSEIEMKAFLGVGSGRIDRVTKNKVAAPRKPPKHAATDDDKKRIVDFILSLDLEPGYPCAHRSVPLYVEGDDQGSTWIQIHNKYKIKCESQKVKFMSYNRFREYAHHYFPTLKLGKTKTDMCNECFTIKLKLDDPETDAVEKARLRAKLSVHLGESNTQRRAMNAYIHLVKKKKAPNDPPLNFEPCHIEDLCDEVLTEALNLIKENPVIAAEYQDLHDEIENENFELDINCNTTDNDVQESNSLLSKDGQVPHLSAKTSPEEIIALESNAVTLSRRDTDQNLGSGLNEAKAGMENEKDDTHDNDEMSETLKLTKKAKDSLRAFVMKRTVNQRESFAQSVPEAVSRDLAVTIEDYGSEKPLPHYGLNRPNADYFNSSIHLRNMNIIDPGAGSSIYIYDERVGGKDGNSVCSVRWEHLKNTFTKYRLKNVEPPSHQIGIFDNCVGQNKSNCVFKFEVLQTILGFYSTKNKLFLIPGHSHNSSDVKTAELNNCLKNKNLYTPLQIKEELKQMKNAEAHILQGDHFYEWECLLDKFIKDMPPGFTFYYCFEIVGGRVSMKKLCSDVSDDEVVTKVLVENVGMVRSAILQEMFGLDGDADLEEIIAAPLRLPKLDPNPISEKRLASIKKKYVTIPRQHLWYYPEGEEYITGASNSEEKSEKTVSSDVPKKKSGRPKCVPKVSSKTPSILNFFKAFPSIPKPVAPKLSTSSQPTATKPPVTQPLVTQPSVTQPSVTQPSVTQPAMSSRFKFQAAPSFKNHEGDLIDDFGEEIASDDDLDQPEDGGDAIGRLSTTRDELDDIYDSILDG